MHYGQNQSLLMCFPKEGDEFRKAILISCAGFPNRMMLIFEMLGMNFLLGKGDMEERSIDELALTLVVWRMWSSSNASNSASAVD